MFHINIPHLDERVPDEETLKELQTKYTVSYQNLIVDKILNQPRHVSACLNCGAETSNTSTPFDMREIIEVNCKGLLGTDFVEINNEILSGLQHEDIVIIQSNNDFQECAKIQEKGEIVRIKRRELGLYGEELPYVIRKATDEDYEKINENLIKEKEAVPIFREKVKKYGLEMKFVDVHLQYDRKKLFFFYTANGRVDFRELAKDLASVFRTRIELRQIGARDEAKKIGGIGMCGREYCCTTFMNGFKRITTQIASEQNLNTSLSKLSGPCGKLKCCLSFEIDTN